VQLISPNGYSVTWEKFMTRRRQVCDRDNKVHLL